MGKTRESVPILSRESMCGLCLYQAPTNLGDCDVIWVKMFSKTPRILMISAPWRAWAEGFKGGHRGLKGFGGGNRDGSHGSTNSAEQTFFAAQTFFAEQIFFSKVRLQSRDVSVPEPWLPLQNLCNSMSGARTCRTLRLVYLLICRSTR